MLHSLKKTYLRWKLNPALVVVSGLPRSGTSMMMKMLEGGGMPLLVDGIRNADDDNPLGYYELESVMSLLKEEDKSWLSQGRGKAVKIVSTLLPGLPASYFYKVIFMHRRLDEVIPSQNKMLRRRGEPVDEAGDARMRDLLERHLVKTKLWLARQPNFDVCQVRYRQVIADPHGEALRVRDFLKTDLNVKKMACAVNTDLYRNRRDAVSHQPAGSS
jgi:hypothetical protein